MARISLRRATSGSDCSLERCFSALHQHEKAEASPGFGLHSEWSGSGPSSRIVHHELERMRRHLEALHFRHLQVHVAVDEVVVEDAALLQEVAVLVEAAQRLSQGPANG